MRMTVKTTVAKVEIDINSSTATKNIDQIKKGLEGLSKTINNINGMKLDVATKSAKSFGSVAHTAGNKAAAGQRAYINEMKSSIHFSAIQSTQLRHLSKAMTGLNKVMVSGIKEAIGEFQQFEKSVTQIAGLSAGVSGDFASEFSRIGKSVKDLAATTIFSTKDVADGFLNLTQAGITGADATNAMTEATKLATAAQLSLKQATEVTKATMKGYELGIGDLSEANNILLSATSNSNTELISLNKAMAKAAPSANNFGIGVSEVAAFMGVMGDSLVSGTTAGTAFNQVMSRMSKPSDSISNALKRLGISAESVRKDGFGGMIKAMNQAKGSMDQLDFDKTMSIAFGARAALTMSKFGNAGEEAFNRLIRKGKEAVNLDFAGKLAARNEATFDAKMKLLESKLSAFSNTIGEKLSIPLGKLADIASVALDGLNGLSDETIDGFMNLGQAFLFAGTALSGILGVGTLAAGLTALGGSAAFSTVSTGALGAATTATSLSTGILGATSSGTSVAIRGFAASEMAATATTAALGTAAAGATAPLAGLGATLTGIGTVLGGTVVTVLAGVAAGLLLAEAAAQSFNINMKILNKVFGFSFKDNYSVFGSFIDLFHAGAEIIGDDTHTVAGRFKMLMGVMSDTGLALDSATAKMEKLDTSVKNSHTALNQFIKDNGDLESITQKLNKAQDDATDLQYKLNSLRETGADNTKEQREEVAKLTKKMEDAKTAASKYTSQLQTLTGMRKLDTVELLKQQKQTLALAVAQTGATLSSASGGLYDSGQKAVVTAFESILNEGTFAFAAGKDRKESAEQGMTLTSNFDSQISTLDKTIGEWAADGKNQAVAWGKALKDRVIAQRELTSNLSAITKELKLISLTMGGKGSIKETQNDAITKIAEIFGKNLNYQDSKSQIENVKATSEAKFRSQGLVGEDLKKALKPIVEQVDTTVKDLKAIEVDKIVATITAKVGGAQSNAELDSAYKAAEIKLSGLGLNARETANALAGLMAAINDAKNNKGKKGGTAAAAVSTITTGGVEANKKKAKAMFNNFGNDLGAAKSSDEAVKTFNNLRDSIASTGIAQEEQNYYVSLANRQLLSYVDSLEKAEALAAQNKSIQKGEEKFNAEIIAQQAKAAKDKDDADKKALERAEIEKKRSEAIVKVTEKTVEAIDAFAEGVLSVVDLFSNLAQTLLPAFGAFGNNELTSLFSGLAGNIIDGASGATGSAIQGFVNAGTSLITTAGTVLAGAGGGATISTVLAGLGLSPVTLGGSIPIAAITGAVAGIALAISDLGEFITNLSDSIMDITGTMLEFGVSMLQQTDSFKKVESIMDGFILQMVESVEPLADMILQLTEGPMAQLAGLVGSGLGEVVDMIVSKGDTFSKMFNDILPYLEFFSTAMLSATHVFLEIISKMDASLIIAGLLTMVSLINITTGTIQTIANIFIGMGWAVEVAGLAIQATFWDIVHLFDWGVKYLKSSFKIMALQVTNPFGQNDEAIAREERARDNISTYAGGEAAAAKRELDAKIAAGPNWIDDYEPIDYDAMFTAVAKGTEAGNNALLNGPSGFKANLARWNVGSSQYNRDARAITRATSNASYVSTISNTYTGAITIMANDPREFERNLRQRNIDDGRTGGRSPFDL